MIATRVRPGGLGPRGPYEVRARTPAARPARRRAGRPPSSISSSVITSGGASRIVEPCVSLASTPRATSRSQTSRPLISAGSMSTPAHRPRPRTATTPCHAAGPIRPRSRSCRTRAELPGPAWNSPVAEQLDHRRADRAGERVAAERRAVLAGLEHAEHVRVRRPPRRPARCRRRAPCPARTCRGRRPRGRRRRSSPVRPRPDWISSAMNSTPRSRCRARGRRRGSRPAAR